MVLYQAIFFDKNNIERLVNMQGEKLENVQELMHCTFGFCPSEEQINKFSQILGRIITLKVIGYGSDGKNSGFEVELSPELEEVYANATRKGNKIRPHITVSMAAGAKAKDTATLQFSPLEEPFEIVGIAGYIEQDKGNGTKQLITRQQKQTTHDENEEDQQTER